MYVYAAHSHTHSQSHAAINARFVSKHPEGEQCVVSAIVGDGPLVAGW